MPAIGPASGFVPSPPAKNTARPKANAIGFASAIKGEGEAPFHLTQLSGSAKKVEKYR
jgi:hypothetical protein